MKEKYLTPWKKIGNYSNLKRLVLGTTKEVAQVWQNRNTNKYGIYTMESMYLGVPNRAFHYPIYNFPDIWFDTEDAAKEAIDAHLIELGYTLLDEERANKLLVLI